jgi:hypothetical protein
MELWVINDKGVEERVTEIVLTPELTGVGRILVTSYSRDPAVMQPSSGSNYERREVIAQAGELNAKKLSSFAGYLRDRKKAAVIKLDQGECFIVADASGSGGVFLLRKPMQVPRSAPSQAASAAPPKPAPAKASLLQSLSARVVGSEPTRRAEAVAEKAKIATVVDFFKDLESKIRAQLDQFSVNPELNELRLEPMDKDGRYVVHDVVTDYPNLLSTAIGDYDERHVVVYRLGHQPAGVDLSALHPSEYSRKGFSKRRTEVDLTAPVIPINRHPGGSSSSSSSSSSAGAAAGAGDGGVSAGAVAPGPAVGVGNGALLATTKVGLVKRDRRTTEEVERDIKRRKGQA